jgi:NADP-dependent 3-hydroxy acid dehydrogenase YdfG
MKDLSGKIAFITGGGSGVGLGIAQAFLEAGMRTVVSDFMPQHLEEAQAHLHSYRDNVRFIRLDVRDRAAFAAAADEAEQMFGKVHVVCNNAGVGSNTPMLEALGAEWDWLFGVNVGGLINGIVTFVPRLLALGAPGHIVNTASITALIPLADAGIYTGTKCAIRGISDALRLNLAPHAIGVSTLCPGLVRSRIFDASRYRPADLPTQAPQGPNLSDELVKQLASAAMDPLEVGRRVVAGIRDNRAYILTHQEFLEEAREEFEAVLADFPRGEVVNPARLGLERESRAARDRMRDVVKRLGS